MTNYLALNAGGLNYVVEYPPSGVPAAPTQYPVQAYAPPVGGTTWYAYVAGEGAPYNNATNTLQYCLTNCASGDVVVLKAGSTYTTANDGFFNVPDNKAGTDWIYVISSDLASLTEGTRVAPGDVAHMAKLTAYDNKQPTVIIAEGASKVRFAGLEITTNNASATAQYGLVRVGWKDVPWVPSTTNYSADVVFERCYIHGSEAPLNAGIVAYNVAGFALRDCYVSNIKTATGGGYDESNAVWLHGAPGPTLVHNNYIEGTGINFFIGDSSAILNDLGNPVYDADVTCTNNWIRKLRSWDVEDATYGGTNYYCKNLWETKGVLRCLVEGNQLDNSFMVGGQHASVFVVKSNSGNVEDLVIRNNFASNGGTFLQLTAQSFGGPENEGEPDNVPLQIKRVQFVNNLAIDMQSRSAVGNYELHSKLNHVECAVTDLTIEHNTVVVTTNHPGSTLAGSCIGYEAMVTDAFGADYSFSDNILFFNLYGMFYGGSAGNTAYSAYMASSTLTHNVLVRNLVGDYYASARYTDTGGYNNWMVAANPAAVGFVDLNGTTPGDFALAAESTYKGDGSDGADPGCNAAAITAAIAGVV
jgi:hypothetical protein